MSNGSYSYYTHVCFQGLFSLKITEMVLLKDFHSHAALTLWVYQPTSHCPTLSLLVQNQSPQNIAGSDTTNCLTHTCYVISFR